MRHGGMVERREEEHESCFAQALGGLLRAELDGDAQGFKHVGRAATGSDGAIAVLGHFGSGSGRDQRSA